MCFVFGADPLIQHIGDDKFGETGAPQRVTGTRRRFVFPIFFREIHDVFRILSGDVCHFFRDSLHIWQGGVLLMGDSCRKRRGGLSQQRSHDPFNIVPGDAFNLMAKRNSTKNQMAYG